MICLSSGQRRAVEAEQAWMLPIYVLIGLGAAAAGSGPVKVLGYVWRS